MLYLVNDSCNPYFNMALEEYIFSSEKFNDDVIIIWRNEESVFLGKNQNPYVELLHDIIRTRKIPILRRISGGGTVYHDLGNVNMTFIKKNIRLDEIDFIKHTRFMQEMLINFGVDATYSDRKDLLVNGKKISGSAQSIKGTKCLYHGTLLFDADLDKLNAYLNSNKVATSNATKSVRSKVCNLNEILDMSIEEFIDNIKHYIIENTNKPQQIVLDDEDLKRINEKKENIYSTDEWIFERTPKFSVDIEEEGVNLSAVVNKWKVKSLEISKNESDIKLDKLEGELFFEDNIIEIADREYIEYRDILSKIF